MATDLSQVPPYVDGTGVVTNPSATSSTFQGTYAPDTLNVNAVNKSQNIVDALISLEALQLSTDPFGPGAYGLTTFNYPPISINFALSATAATTAEGLWVAVPIVKAVTLTKLAYVVSVASGTPATGSNFFQVFSLAGASLGYTTATTTLTDEGTAGFYNEALTATSATAGPNGGSTLQVSPAVNPFVIVVAQVKGTTLPRFAGQGGTVVSQSTVPLSTAMQATLNTTTSPYGTYATFTAAGTAATVADFAGADNTNFWCGLT